MRISKRMLAVALCVVMLVSALPLYGFAQGEGGATAVEDELSIQATNSLGAVFSAGLEQSAEEREADYAVTGLSFSGRQATVTFGNLEACRLVVAIYSEAGQMLASGMGDVEAQAEGAVVEINVDSMPQHFIAKAFLLSDQNAALCKPFYSIENTEYYEEFMEKTVEDFDEESVIINFDEQKDDNFAVLADGAKQLQTGADVNVLVSADHENKVYTFSHINDEIRSLKAGDVFVHGASNDDLLIVQVKSVSVSGTTATVYGNPDAEMHDYFDYVKVDLESTGEESDMVIDPDELEEGVEYLGMESWNGEEPAKAQKAPDGSEDLLLTTNGDIVNFDPIPATIACPVWKLDKYLVGDKYSTFSVKITGQVKASITYKFKIHYDADISADVEYAWGWLPYVDVDYNSYYNVYVNFDNAFTGTVSLTGAVDKKFLLAAPSFITPVGISIGIGFRFHVQVSASVTFEIAKVSNSVGISAESGKGVDGWFTTPKIELFPKLEGKATIKFGIIITPNVGLARLLEVGVNGEIGAFAEVTWFTTADDPLADHLCQHCLKGEVDGFAEASIAAYAAAQQLGKDGWKITPEFKFKIRDFYISLDFHDFGWGVCPHRGSGSGGGDGTGSNDTAFTGSEAVGAVINFGSYPQSRATGYTLLTKLDNAPKTWRSYNYYSGSGSWNDGQMAPSSYMMYCDVKVDGDKYRAVTFTQHRPHGTGYEADASNSNQDENGYSPDNVYYFKYEPLRWRVLDAAEGLVMCDTVIDSQAYNNFVLYANDRYWGDAAKTYYASDWANSSLRNWLNQDFYNTAFSPAQQARIEQTHLENKRTYSSDYDSKDTVDKVFLLSWWDVHNTAYGFGASTDSSTGRQWKSTDYAQCQGCYVNSSHNSSYWWLRSPVINSYIACSVSTGGNVNYTYRVDGTNVGVVPALRLSVSVNLKSPAAAKKSPARAASAEEGAAMRFECGACAADADYVLLHVTGYGESFTLTNENLLYIDQLTADSSGRLSACFIPRRSDPDAVTLLVGDFGSGVEARLLAADAANSFTLTYSANGGTGAPAAQTGNGAVTLSAAKPTRDGYVFLGWSTNQAAVAAPFQPGAGFNLTWDTTLYAVWQKIEPPQPQGRVKAVALGDVSINYKSSTTLKPTVTADEGVTYAVSYTSSNPNAVSVDGSGRVTGLKKGSATVTCTVTDSYGNTVRDSCTVSVNYTWWQWIIIIVLFGWLWY